MRINNNTRESMLLFIEEMIRNDTLHSDDLRIFQRNPEPCSPEEVRQTLETWYIGMGIESIIGRHLVLSHSDSCTGKTQKGIRSLSRGSYSRQRLLQ